MLEKNLEALEKFQPGLVKILRETEVTGKVELFLNENQDVNMAYENIALHDIDDPIGEAKRVFDENIGESECDEQTIILQFGLGLGYLLKRSFINSKSVLLIFEPLPEVLLQTLEAVDFSAEIESKRIYFLTEVAHVAPAVNKFYFKGDDLKSMALPSYQARYPELFLEMLNEIKSGMYVTIVSQNTASKMMSEFITVSLQNMPEFLQYPDAALMHDKFKGRAGVVVSAGPSLDKPGVLETLAKYRDKFIISAVGQAAKALDKAGIVPDFLSVVECKDVSQQFTGVSYLDDVNLILLPQTNKKLYSTPSKRKMIAYSSQDPLTQWLSVTLDESLFGYNHQGTVSITALIHLMKMGCNPIFLLGQDLAFPEGKMYSNNSVYKNCSMTVNADGTKSVKMDNLDDFYGAYGFFKDRAEWDATMSSFVGALTEVKGWEGQKLYTNVSYDGFRKYFEFIGSKHPEFNLVNCSEGGAFLANYEHLPFPEAVEKYAIADAGNAREELEQFLSENFHQEEIGSEKYKKVYMQYLKDYQDLLYLKDVTAKSLNQLGQISRDAEKMKVMTNSLQSRLKKLSFLDEELARITKLTPLINAYMKGAMYEFSRNYGRKMELNQEVEAGNMDELKENLDTTEKLYEAIQSGTEELLSVLEPVFANFPGATEAGPNQTDLDLEWLSTAKQNPALNPG